MSREHLFHQSAGAPACDGTCGSAAMARWQPLQGPGWEVRFDQFGGRRRLERTKNFTRECLICSTRSRASLWKTKPLQEPTWVARGLENKLWNRRNRPRDGKLHLRIILGLTPCGGRQALAGTGRHGRTLAGTGSHSAKRLQGWDGWMAGWAGGSRYT